MRSGGLLLCLLLVVCPLKSHAQEQNSWGESFNCAIDWFSRCVPDKAIRDKEQGRSKEMAPGTVGGFVFPQGPNNLNFPAPVRNVLENPSLETARAYVLWSRQANEKLAKASEYITQATREMNEAAGLRNNTEKIDSFAGMGPVGLYYFFSPADRSAAKDVAVLNKIWQEGRLGVVGIPVKPNDGEIASFVNEARPLFPIRTSDAEVKLIKPTETPDLYLALPLEKKLFRIGSITETAISEAIGKIMAGLSAGN